MSEGYMMWILWRMGQACEWMAQNPRMEQDRRWCHEYLSEVTFGSDISQRQSTPHLPYMVLFALLLWVRAVERPARTHKAEMSIIHWGSSLPLQW